MTAPYPHKVSFLRASLVEDGHGGHVASEAEVHAAWVRMIFKSGSEGDEAGRQVGRGFIKIKMPSCVAARGLATDDVMIDRDGRRYNIRSVDPVTDAAAVWLDVEFGVPTENGGGV